MVKFQSKARQQQKQVQQQRLTLLLLFSGLAILSLVLWTLYQIDAFPRKRNFHKATAPNVQALTPDKLVSAPQQDILQQQKQQEQEKVEVNENNNAEKVGNLRKVNQQLVAETEVEEEGEMTGPEIIPDAEDAEFAGQSIRYEMKLQNLLPNSEGSTSGVVTIEVQPNWAPIGAKHFIQLVNDKHYDDARFFRCLPNFMVQFGIAAHPEQQEKWRADKLKDDPVMHTNDRGTISYAMGGKNTRTTQLFINTREDGNMYLDEQGFSPFAKVVQGMEFVDRINHEYKEKPNQGKIVNRGNKYLQEEFPRLSYIESIRQIASSDKKEEEHDAEGEEEENR